MVIEDGDLEKVSMFYKVGPEVGEEWTKCTKGGIVTLSIDITVDGRGEIGRGGVGDCGIRGVHGVVAGMGDEVCGGSSPISLWRESIIYSSSSSDV
jgi:hypothetical protein